MSMPVLLQSMEFLQLPHSFYLYIPIFFVSVWAVIIPLYILSLVWFFKNHLLSSIEASLSTYFCHCNLTPIKVDLDGDTTMNIWTTKHRQFNKPNLVMVHGYAGNSRWQFVLQLRTLSKNFNVYIPDLLFFGDSFTKRTERSDKFQAECVCEAMKKIGVEKYSLFSISYGGFVAYRMAEMYSESIDKVVIASAGVGCTAEQKAAQMKEIETSVEDLLVPKVPDHYRKLVSLCFHRFNIGKWLPDFVLRECIRTLINPNRKQKEELVEFLVKWDMNSALPPLSQETLLVWGEKDIAFPLCMGHQLQRHLGPTSKLEIIKNAGHATILESPHELNKLIISFLLGRSSN